MHFYNKIDFNIKNNCLLGLTVLEKQDCTCNSVRADKFSVRSDSIH